MAERAVDIWRDLAWDAAADLGVSSWARGNVHTVVDPEALLAISALLDDARLRGELLDLSIQHASLLMPSRMRRLAAECGEPAASVIEQWIATIDAHSSLVRWTSTKPALDGYVPSGKSRPTELASAASGALRARALGGATARTELLRGLHPVARGLAPSIGRSELVHVAAVARGQVHVVLHELQQAGFIRIGGSSRRQLIAPRSGSPNGLADGYWTAWRELPHGPWREAPRIAAALICVDRDPPIETPRSWAAEVVMRFRDALLKLEAMGAPDTVLGAARPLDVHAEARRAARDLSRWYAAALRGEVHQSPA